MTLKLRGINSFREMRIRKLLLLFVSLSVFVWFKAQAYEFTYDNALYSLWDQKKIDIDKIVSSKIKTQDTVNRYIKALAKLDISKIDYDKRAVYYYLLSELEKIAGKTSWSSLNQNVIVKTYELNKPLAIPVDTSNPNTTSSDTTKLLPEYERVFVSEIKAKVNRYIEIDDNFEFEENWNTYMVNFNKYYIVEFDKPISLYTSLKNLSNEALIKKWSDFFITKWWFTVEKKLTLKELSSLSKVATENNDPVIFSYSWWYLHAFKKYDYTYFPVDNSWIYLSQYSSVKDIRQTILTKKWSKFILVTWYNEISIVPANIFDKLENKSGFLDAISKDMYNYTWSDITNLLMKIRTKTMALTQGLQTDQDKIEAIYSWITKNIKYDEYSMKFLKWEINEQTYLKNVDTNIFTWIWWFESWNAVCDWYSKLFLYMLSFAWIKDVSIETGKAKIWENQIVTHAWNRIWNKLYDVTWDIDQWNNTGSLKWFAMDPETFYKDHYK